MCPWSSTLGWAAVRPSLALEAGASAVLVNTAIAQATDPVRMAEAFAMGVRAGREAYLAGRIPRKELAQASSPFKASFVRYDLFSRAS